MQHNKVINTYSQMAGTVLSTLNILTDPVVSFLPHLIIEAN